MKFAYLTEKIFCVMIRKCNKALVLVLHSKMQRAENLCNWLFASIVKKTFRAVSFCSKVFCIAKKC